MDIKSLTQLKPTPNIPNLSPGDTVRVSTRVIEGGRERTQVFEGVILSMRRGGAGSNFTVRRITRGIGVERTFLLHSPHLEKVEVLSHGKVRRAKLYYLRGLSRKKARLQEKTRPRK